MMMEEKNIWKVEAMIFRHPCQGVGHIQRMENRKNIECRNKSKKEGWS